MKSIKVLISAYACRPNQGSEPGVGWNVSRELAKHHQVWVITREDNRPTIEAEIAKNPVPGLHVVYYDLPAWVRWWYRGQHWGVQFHYYLWQIGVYFVARKLHQEVGFDLIHHVTYVKYWSPSFLSLLPVPFIWGPVGGGESAPKAFWRDFSWRGKVYETLRDIARGLGENDPFVRMTIRHSAIAQSTTEDTAKRLHKIGATNVQILSETALASEEIARLAQHALPNDDSSIKFISMGRLLHWKGFHLGIRAFAQADLPEEAEYWLLGNGPERQRLQALAESLGIAHRVKFWDRLPREETLQKLSECVALVHPSLHDSGGWVCLEAMATGRPVLCLDLGGPAVQVTSETGFKVAAHTPEQAVRDLAEAMTLLSQDSSLSMRMGHAGKKRVSEAYSWEAKGDRSTDFTQNFWLANKGSHPTDFNFVCCCITPTIYSHLMLEEHDMSKPLVFFSGLLLPPSETFIRAQGEGLQQYTPYYVGSRQVKGLSLPSERTLVVNHGGVIGAAQEALFKVLGHAPNLYQQVQQLNPALIHAHFGVCGALALPLVKALKLPLIVTFYGLDATMKDEYARRNSISTRVYLQRREALKREARLFIAVSEFIRDKLLEQGFPAERTIAHYYGVDTEAFQPDPAVSRKPIVLFVGRLAEKKGCEYLIRAMAQVQAEMSKVELVIIGDGLLRQELELLAASVLRRYQFLGLQPQSVVKSWMNQASLLAVPSVTAATGDSEGLPTVVVEAQAMGLPVVGSIHAGIPQAVVHGETGLLSPERDWQALAVNILRLMQDPQLRQRFSDRGQQRVQTLFNLHKQTRYLEDIYEAVLRGEV